MTYSQSWMPDRWQQPNTGADYAAMNSMVYDPRTLPSTGAVQRPTLAPQYPLPLTYAESPVTPMSASPYGSHAQFGEYQPYSYQAPEASTPYVHSHRPVAPPTPPLEDDRGMRYRDQRPVQTVKSTARRSPRRSVSVVKSEVNMNPTREIKTCPTYVKKDGSLQHQSDKKIDEALRLFKMKLPLRSKDAASAPTPESTASSPGSELEAGRKQPAKDKECPYCHKMFAQKAQLDTHIRAHTGEKPYQCDICGIYVSQPGNLKAHKRRHTKERPFACTWEGCHQRFAANGSMKVHVNNIHLKLAKLSCPIPKCEKTFTTIGNMKVHINKYHEPALNMYLNMITQHDASQPFPEDVAELWEKLLSIYKNSNCGIKGRGVDDPRVRELDKLLQEKREREQLNQRMQLTPISPDASPSVHQYRTTYYDQQQQQQQHYAVRPHQAQHSQQSPEYMHQLPSHQSQPIFHGLPHPTPYSMAWTPGQYH